MRFISIIRVWGGLFGVFFCFFSGEKFWPALWHVQWLQPGCQTSGNPGHRASSHPLINTALRTQTTQESQLHIPTARAASRAVFHAVFRTTRVNPVGVQAWRSKAVPESFLQPFPNRISQTNKRVFLCGNSASCR